MTSEQWRSLDKFKFLRGNQIQVNWSLIPHKPFNAFICFTTYQAWLLNTKAKCFLGVYHPADFVESFSLWKNSCTAFWQEYFLLFILYANGQPLWSCHSCWPYLCFNKCWNYTLLEAGGGQWINIVLCLPLSGDYEARWNWRPLLYIISW